MKKIIVSALDFFTARGDKIEFLKRCRDNGANSLRIIYQYSWGDNVLSPYLQVGNWKADYQEAPEMPFYAQGDQDAIWDPLYLSKLDYGHALIAGYIPEVYAVLHDNTSFKMEGWEKYRYPFLSSSPDRKLDNPNYSKYSGGFWGLREYEGGAKTVQFLHLRLASLIINSLKKHGLKIILEFNNEDLVQGWNDVFVEDYYKWLRDSFANLGISQSDIIACGRMAALEFIGCYSQHGIAKPDFPSLAIPEEMILLSTDGGFNGEGDADQHGRKGISASDAKLLAEKSIKEGYIGIEYLSRRMYKKKNNQANLDDFNPEPLLEISKIYQGGNMSEWKPGGGVSVWLPVDNQFVCEVGDARLIGINSGSKFYYSVRRWKGGTTYFSKPKLISTEVTNPNQGVQVFKSQKDGFYQFICGNSEHFRKPADIPELTEPIDGDGP